jgi:hypothetical protein
LRAVLEGRADGEREREKEEGRGYEGGEAGRARRAILAYNHIVQEMALDRTSIVR